MQRKALIRAAMAFVIITAPAAHTIAQSGPLQFESTELPPPPEPVQTQTPQTTMPALYDILVTGDVSPLGTKASSVEAKALFQTAWTFLRGDNNHPANQDEAAYWLKRAIFMGIDETGANRAWAMTMLGKIIYASNKPDAHPDAKLLWEIAAAWNNSYALCSLGQYAEDEDKDRNEARMWYERAQKAGCAKATEALAKLKQ